MSACRELDEIWNEPVPWDEERENYLKEIYGKFLAESSRRIRAECWKNAKAAAEGPGARRAAAARGERGAALAEGLRRQVEERRARLAAERAVEAVGHESPRARRSLLQCCRCSRCLPAGRFSTNPYRMPHPVSAAAAARR
eukprot:tig00001222_g7610.t1